MLFRGQKVLLEKILLLTGVTKDLIPADTKSLTKNCGRISAISIKPPPLFLTSKTNPSVSDKLPTSNDLILRMTRSISFGTND